MFGNGFFESDSGSYVARGMPKQHLISKRSPYAIRGKHLQKTSMSCFNAAINPVLPHELLAISVNDLNVSVLLHMYFPKMGQYTKDVQV